MTVQHHLVLKLSAIGRLVSGFDLDCDGRLSLFAERDLLVFALDRGDAAEGDDFFGVGHGVVFDGCDGGVEAEGAVGDVDTDDDGIGLVEDSVGKWSVYGQ